MRTEVRTLLAQDFGTRSPADLSTLLRHVDMRVRQKAQFELVTRGEVQTLLAAAQDRANRLARVHALWGLGQLARKQRNTPRFWRLFFPTTTGSMLKPGRQADR